MNTLLVAPLLVCFAQLIIGSIASARRVRGAFEIIVTAIVGFTMFFHVWIVAAMK